MSGSNQDSNQLSDMFSEGEELSIFHLARLFGATKEDIDPDFKAKVLDALASGELILTENRKLKVSDGCV